MKGKPMTIWTNEGQEKMLRDKAKKEKCSLSHFIKSKCGLYNKRGQVGVWAYALMLSIVVIILALSLAPVLKTFVDSAMGTTTADFIGLDCDTTTSNFIKGVCVIVDFSLAYFILGLILIGVGLLTARYI